MRAIIFEESGSFKGIYHLCHFVELMTVAFVEIAQRGWGCDSIEAIMFPRWTTPNWRGRSHDHNRILIELCFPNAVISTAHEGPRVQPSEFVHVDRNKLVSNAIGQPQVKFIQRLNATAWYESIQGPVHHNDVTHVTYVSRQQAPRRRLHPAIHARIVSQLEKLDGIRFREVCMEHHDFATQLDIARTTDVLIGVHGNGLTHAMFMRPKKFVCEIFVPRGVFQWHYYTMSSAMGHKYQCMFDGQASSPASFRIGRPVCQSHSLDMLDLIGFVRLAQEEIQRL